jgi:hypothetical protein
VEFLAFSNLPEQYFNQGTSENYWYGQSNQAAEYLTVNKGISNQLSLNSWSAEGWLVLATLGSLGVVFLLIPYLLSRTIATRLNTSTVPIIILPPRLLYFTALCLLSLIAYKVKLFSFNSLILLSFWLVYCSRQPSLFTILSNKILFIIDLWDLGQGWVYCYKQWTRLQARLITPFRNYRLASEQQHYQTWCLGLIVAVASYYRLYWPSQEWRFAQPNSYSILLHANQLLANQADLPWSTTAQLSSLLTALIALVAAIPAMAVVRWLGAFVGIAITMALVKLLQKAEFSAHISLLTGHFLAISAVQHWLIHPVILTRGISKIASGLTVWVDNSTIPMTSATTLNTTTPLIGELIQLQAAWQSWSAPSFAAPHTLNDPYLAVLLLIGAMWIQLTDYPQRSRRDQLLSWLTYIVLMGLTTPVLLPALLVLLTLRPQRLRQNTLGLMGLALAGILAAILALRFPTTSLGAMLQPTITLLPLSLLLFLATLVQAANLVNDFLRGKLQPAPATANTTKINIFNLGTLIIIITTWLWLPPLPALTPATVSTTPQPLDFLSWERSTFSSQYGQYLEHDSSARQTYRILQQFPAKTYLLVAPVEQLAQVYGTGRYADLAAFTRQYATLVNNPQFQFSLDLATLFIMVEKQPFATFSQETTVLNPTLLSDPTYRHYRSLAGRSSLQFQALQLCRTYQQHHPQLSQIYYEDDWIIIYQFAGK